MVSQGTIDLFASVVVILCFGVWVWSISKKQSIKETVDEIKSIISGK